MADSDEELDGEETPGESSVIKTLRQKVKDLERRPTAEELAQTQRELALWKAGLGDLSDKQVKALAAAHDGEFTPEALKATATELGFAKAEAPAPQQSDQQQQPTALGVDLAAMNAQIEAEELATVQRITDASVSSTPANPDPNQLLIKQMNEAKSPEELDAILARAGLLQQQ